MRIFKKALAAAVLAFGFTAPAIADDRPELVVAVNNLPGSLESIEEMGNVAVRITYSMFDSLIRRDFLADDTGASSKLVPGLAESWTQIDNRTMELKLREGVKFHNGDELTSDDVVFSLSAGRGHGYNPLVGAARRFMLTLSHVEPVDKYTVRIVSKEPDVLLDQRLAGYAMWIVNAREYMLKGKDAFARNPVGTGPYKMDEWVEGEYIRLAAHDDYFGGMPTAKSITFKVVPEVSARIAGLVSGEYDIIVNVPPDQVPVLNGYDDVKVESVVLDNTHMLVFFNEGPLESKLVRQALSKSIDRALLREALWEDKNYTPNGHQLPSYVMHIKDFPEFEYSPEKARELLSEAGYNGEEIVYKLPLNYYLLSLEAAQAMQQMWKDVGLNVKLEPVENWTQVNDKDSTVHIRPWSNTHRMPDPLGSFVPQWGKDSSVQNNKQLASRSWKAPEKFNELHDVIVAGTDMEVRQQAYREALEIWNDEAPGTMLYNPLETYALKKDIQWRPVSLYYMDFRPDNLKFGAAE
ncbi:ABC transporter substrate-binding protein [uncultured Roseibium sp.]|uniref:ABC transporter substrate-binding protein n=1 Tax=uncultured Roseibium sp. TaxID=1936171 RepID=UPI0025954AC0|nr:ABC transporter substrate-binding protein [uncultured Roseibium sp.]